MVSLSSLLINTPAQAAPALKPEGEKDVVRKEGRKSGCGLLGGGFG